MSGGRPRRPAAPQRDPQKCDHLRPVMSGPADSGAVGCRTRLLKFTKTQFGIGRGAVHGRRPSLPQRPSLTSLLRGQSRTTRRPRYSTPLAGRQCSYSTLDGGSGPWAAEAATCEPSSSGSMSTKSRCKGPSWFCERQRFAAHLAGRALPAGRAPRRQFTIGRPVRPGQPGLAVETPFRASLGGAEAHCSMPSSHEPSRLR